MAHIHELIDFIVDIFIVHNNKVFLRLHDKYNIWLPVGGHIELNEDHNQAVIRECKEEAGLDVRFPEKYIPKEQISDYKAGYKELVPPQHLNIHTINETHRHIGLVYFVISDSEGIKPEGEDVSDTYRWVAMEELDNFKELSPRVRFYAKKALEALGSN
jgi:8-oxo-dGTP pyrophosphatase MutT (NUDIX family)